MFKNIWNVLKPKLKIAVVLLVIGAFSGLSIWGTHTLTYDRIQENRARARLQVYLDIFPDMDTTLEDPEDITSSILGMRLVEEPEHSTVFEKYDVYDANNTQLGYLMRGRANNDFGYVEVIVGVDMNGVIIDVVISETDNTPSYYTPLINNYMGNFKGQTLADVEFDSNTGATATYNVVRRVVEDSILLIEGDPILSIYQDAIDGVDRYETSYAFLLGVIVEEVRLIDASNDTVGYAYIGHVSYEGHDYRIAVIVSADETLADFVVLEETVPSGLSDALALFDAYIGLALADINVSDESGALEEALQAVLEAGLRRADETEEIRAYRDFFIDAARVEAEAITDDVLTELVTVYNESDEVVGYVFEGQAANADPSGAFGGSNITAGVALNSDGEVVTFVFMDYDDSGWAIDDVRDAIDVFYGRSDISDIELDDAFSGVTTSARSVSDIIEAALNYFETEMGSE